MPYDVFISHSTKDKLVADAVCNRLESAGIRCWIAPRDIIPGEGWSAAILRGIDSSKVMVLIFSENANTSAHVRREVAHACDHEITVIPMRIRDVTPKEGLKYYLDELHWLDALTPPLASHLEALTSRVSNILTGEQKAELRGPTDKNAPKPPSAADVAKGGDGAKSASAIGRWSIVVGVLVLLLVLIGGFFWVQNRSNQPSTTAAQATPEATQDLSNITLSDGTRVKLGDQQIILNDKDLGLRDIGGKGVAIIENGPTQVRFLTQVFNDTYLITGPSFKQLTSATKVLGPGDAGQFDNAGAGADTIIQVDGRLYAFYEGRDREGQLPMNGEAGFRGVYCGIGLAASANDGATWAKLGEIIRSPKPKEWSDWSGQSVRGVGSPSALIDATNTYVYLYYVAFSGVLNGLPVICMARAPLSKGPPLADNWKKFYQGDFTEPGLGGIATPIVDGHAENSGVMYPHVIYSKSLKKYILTYNLNRLAESKQELPLTKSGIYLALSDDGIHWSTPTKLISTYSQRMISLSISIEPTIIFDTPAGLTGWLLYAYTPKYSNGPSYGTPLFLAGRRIDFVPK